MDKFEVKDGKVIINDEELAKFLETASERHQQDIYKMVVSLLFELKTIIEKAKQNQPTTLT